MTHPHLEGLIRKYEKRRANWEKSSSSFAEELADWRELFVAVCGQGLDKLDPSFKPIPLWPNNWHQDVAVVSGADLGGMDEEPDGEWVRYSDVQAVLAALAGAAPNIGVGVDVSPDGVDVTVVLRDGSVDTVIHHEHHDLPHAPAKAREDDGMDERDAAELLRLRYAMGERLKLADAIELLRAAVSPSGADFCMCPELERRIEAFIGDAALATFAEGGE